MKRKDIHKTARLNGRECERLTNQVIWCSRQSVHRHSHHWIGALWVTLVAFILCDEISSSIIRMARASNFEWFVSTFSLVCGKACLCANHTHRERDAHTPNGSCWLAKRTESYFKNEKYETILLHEVWQVESFPFAHGRSQCAFSRYAKKKRLSVQFVRSIWSNFFTLYGVIQA